MNFGQALGSLLSGNSITRSGWQRQGMSIILQPPTGNVTEPFLAQRLANGECTVYTPNQGDILATDWNIVESTSTGATEAVREKAHA